MNKGENNEDGYPSELFTDFEIDENHSFDKEALEKYNEFENAEVEVPDDINLEEVAALEASSKEEFTLNQIPVPVIRVVEEKDIPLVVVHSKDTVRYEYDSDRGKFVCEHCSKIYKREIYYVKHISKCSLLVEAASDEGKNSLISKKTKENSNKESYQEAQGRMTSSVKQKKKHASAYITTTDEELINLSSDTLSNVLEAAIKHPNHCRKMKSVTPGNKIKAIAEVILDLMKNDKEFSKDQSSYIFTSIIQIIQEHDLLKPASRDAMWKCVLETIHSGQFFSKWFEIVDNTETIKSYKSSIHGLIYFVTMQICYAYIKYENDKAKSAFPQDKNVNFEISLDEENVIYYVSGYIVYSLLKKYKKMKKNQPNNIIADTAVCFFKSLRSTESNDISGENLTDYAKAWTAALDSGGLVKVNDQLFKFICTIECIVRNLLNVQFLKTYKGEDLRDILMKDLSNSISINTQWEEISRFLPSPKLVQHLKSQVLTKWIDLRAHAFVKAYIQILKRKSANENKKVALSKTAEPALRKTLFQ